MHRIPVTNFCPALHWLTTRLVTVLLLTVLTLVTLYPVSAATLHTVGFLVGTGGLGDQSYNDMTMAGLGKARQLWDFTLLVEETDASRASQIKGLERLLADGAEVIVANGAGFGSLIVQYADKYPETLFVVNDYPVDDRPNVASTVFAHEEGSFLAGMLAASVAKGGRLGFIGGVDMPVIHEFFDGYAKGARYVQGDVVVDSAFLSPLGDYSGFTNPSKALAVATRMYNEGVEIIFAAAGLSGNGVIQAARENKKLVIGVDADQDHMAKGYVLTSMMKRVDRAIYREIMKIVNDHFTPGVSYYGLRNLGVSLSPMRFTKHLVSAETLAKIAKAQRDIISGQLILRDLAPAPSQHAKEPESPR